MVGSGGREHALAWKLAQEAEVLVAPGNPGIAADAECLPVSANDFEGLARVAIERSVDLVVIGPEDPLIAGLADYLRSKGLAVYGPGQVGAQLEGSKAFSKDLMARASIPTARFNSFRDAESAKDFARDLYKAGSMPVIKASGNALGKGVVVANSIEEAEDAIEAMIVEKRFGEAGATIVVEERLLGFEFSLLSICSGQDFISLPVAQDYKRAFDGDQGPNTGGMGTYSPVPAVSPDLVKRAEEETVRPLLAELARTGIDYRGTLFCGFMVQDGKPYCLEFNVRFGDPETQTVMKRIGPGLATTLLQAARGEKLQSAEVLDNATVTVVLASGGYPGTYDKGFPITVPDSADPAVKIFHAGTAIQDDALVTSGGRVMAVTAEGGTLEEARSRAYEVSDQIHFSGKQLRRDIAAAAL